MGCAASFSFQNNAYRYNNPALEMACPEGALRVQPGLNSFSDAVKNAKEQNAINAVIRRVKISLEELAEPNGSTAHAISKHCNIDENFYKNAEDAVEGPFIAALKAGLEKGIFVREGRRWNIDDEAGDRLKAGAANAIDCLFLESGLHDETGNDVVIDFPLKVVGQNRDKVKIRAGLVIKGKKEEDVFFSNCTVTGANDRGLAQSMYGQNGSAAMHLKNVCVEKCFGHGVYVQSTTRNTMTDCNVNHNFLCGVFVGGGLSGQACITIEGSATTIHRNLNLSQFETQLSDEKRKEFTEYILKNCGLDTNGGSIHLKSLTAESISTNNGGGGNYKDTDQKCSAGHGLIRFKTPRDGFGCDICGSQSVPTDTVMYGCRECNYDICISCEKNTLGLDKNTSHFYNTGIKEI